MLLSSDQMCTGFFGEGALFKSVGHDLPHSCGGSCGSIHPMIGSGSRVGLEAETADSQRSGNEKCQNSIYLIPAYHVPCQNGFNLPVILPKRAFLFSFSAVLATLLYQFALASSSWPNVSDIPPNFAARSFKLCVICEKMP